MSLTAVVALGPLLDRVAARHRKTADLTAIAVRCPPALAVRADTVRLERAVTNLVDNALRHGDVPVTITVRRSGEQVRIGVRDHGPGFPAEFLAHAFDRFSRADPARGGSGSGLGLAITAAIARSAGGSYGATNHDGDGAHGGAEVWVSFPVAE